MAEESVDADQSESDRKKLRETSNCTISSTAACVLDELVASRAAACSEGSAQRRMLALTLAAPQPYIYNVY